MKIMIILKRISKSKGSVIVDAAMVLPVFIISMAIVLNCILQASYEAKLYNELCQKTLSVSSNLYMSNGDNYSIVSGITDKYKIILNVYYRPFLGDLGDDDSDYANVYIYLKSGKKYHYSGCSTLDNNPGYIVVSKAEAKQQGYTECLLCGLDGNDYFKVK